MYNFKSRVRYSEIDKRKQLDFVSILNYFQDCSTFHSEDVGVGIDYLEEKKRIWLLNSWQVNVIKYPKLGDYITISTWAYDFQSMYGYRNFTISDEDGCICACANSIWVFMDLEKNRPMRITPEDVKMYGSYEKLAMDYAPRKIDIPDILEERDPFYVTSSNIDTNNHVNNAQYIKMAEEFLPDTFTIRQMRAEYRSSAVLGDKVTPRVCCNGKLFTVVLYNQEQKPYTIIEFVNT